MGADGNTLFTSCGKRDSSLLPPKTGCLVWPYWLSVHEQAGVCLCVAALLHHILSSRLGYESCYWSVGRHGSEAKLLWKL